MILFSFITTKQKNQISGFVHKISDMRAPSTGNSYFEFQVQTSPTKAIRAICYSPEKRPKIKDIQEERIAVSIDNVQETIGRRRASEEEYTNYQKKISNNTTNCQLSV